MVRLRWRGCCRSFGFSRWLLALVALTTLILLLVSAVFQPPQEVAEAQGLAQEMSLLERIHVMIVMCHKHNDGSPTEEVIIFRSARTSWNTSVFSSIRSCPRDN